MRLTSVCRASLVLTSVAVACTTAAAQDWNNSGGNAGRYSYTDQLGPDALDLLWSGGPSSIISWQPVIEGDRIFVVRQTGFPPSGEPNGSPIFALDLDTGAQLWRADIPYTAGDWTTWVGGVMNGRVYACRGGNGASVSAPLYCLDAATGNVLWFTTFEIDAGAYDGMVFAPDGDPVIGSFRKIWRVNADDGALVWEADRTGSVSGNCGAAVHNDGVYVVDAAVGGHVIVKYDLASGAELYSSTLMPGTTIQNAAMVGPDGTIYVNRTQNNVTVDFFYAYEDNGAAMTEKWNVASGWTTSSEFCVGPDGSVYMEGPGKVLQRLDPATGAVLDSTDGPLVDGSSGCRFAVDAGGRVFFNNGSFSDGRLWSFDADLTERWSIGVTNINIGGPAFGRDGTLVFCGNGTNIRAYRTPRANCAGDLTGDSIVDFADFGQLSSCWGQPCGDLTGDNTTDFADFSTLSADWGCGL